MTKLSDTSNATVNMSMTLDECRTLCLSNCSCTAYASADIAGNETGCIIWTTELTDLRLYTSMEARVFMSGPNQGESQGHKQGVVAVVVSVLLGTLLIIVIGFCILMKKKKKKKRREARCTAMLGTFSFEDLLDKQGGTSRGEELELPLYDLDTVMAATNDFSTENKLGEGGFGPVYKKSSVAKEQRVYYSESHPKPFRTCLEFMEGRENCMELVDESIGQEFPMAGSLQVYKSGAVVCTRKTRRQANNVICGL
ncbi:hypothetical protein J5N97_011821 [Dioscorea zingiberensis]|uniref:Apple domain-containing protein n=1 Tax=Dioscorea zingiberensis TaxID=325984 RepID=A0A9D5HP37_9LILI|nr:hypothetical protein J5N97_011821 [Dioscorea zingiberensis]